MIDQPDDVKTVGHDAGIGEVLTHQRAVHGGQIVRGGLRRDVILLLAFVSPMRASPFSVSFSASSIRRIPRYRQDAIQTFPEHAVITNRRTIRCSRNETAVAAESSFCNSSTATRSPLNRIRRRISWQKVFAVFGIVGHIY